MTITLNAPRLILLAPLGMFVGALWGQLLTGIPLQKGGGMLQTCDTSMHVGFTTTYLDGYACQFNPQIEPGTNSVSSTRWNYYNGNTWTEAFGSPVVPYFGQEPYPICLTVEAFDESTSMPCSAAVCKVVTPLPYAVCAGLAPSFTIASAQGTTITFANESQFDGGQIASAFWSFGDGATSIASFSPSHDFAGSGPFQVCLTVVSDQPTNCTATLCQWLYIGPGGLPCQELVSQGFVVLQHNELVGVLDTSLTSGMNAQISWDFGDGATASGNIAVHAYAPFQSYNLCGTLRVWGPVLSDTCVSTVCQQVYPYAAVSVPEQAALSGALAWPNPFCEQIMVRPLAQAATLQLLDGTGRVVLERRVGASTDPQPVSMMSLPPGCYTLMLGWGGERRTQRVVKQP